MKKISVIGGGVCLALFAACGGSSTSNPGDAGKQADGQGSTHKDSGAHDSAKGDAGNKPTDAGKDGGKPSTDAGKDSGPVVPTHVLVTVQGGSSSQLVAINLTTKAVDGTLTVADNEAITDGRNASAPFMLGQETDKVWRLDATDPWTIDSSWKVGLKGEPDAGSLNADPYAVVVSGAGGVAYVIRYLSNFIDVITDTADVDGGAPKSRIDLTGVLQAGDGDGVVEATAGVLDATNKVLYVVLGNIDRNTLAPPNYDLLCTTTLSTVVGIDTSTNTIVSLNGHGPKGSIELKGFDPVEDGVIYDAANQRLLIAEAGCTPSTADAAAGTINHGIETVDLKTGTSSILLKDFTTPSDFPGQITAVSTTDVLVSVSYPLTAVYHWNPTMPTLGMVIPNAPLPFAYDPANGQILGAALTGDAGATTDVVAVDLSTGTLSTLATNPFTIATLYLGAATVWPHP